MRIRKTAWHINKWRQLAVQKAISGDDWKVDLRLFKFRLHEWLTGWWVLRKRFEGVHCIERSGVNPGKETSKEKSFVSRTARHAGSKYSCCGCWLMPTAHCNKARRGQSWDEFNAIDFTETSSKLNSQTKAFLKQAAVALRFAKSNFKNSSPLAAEC